MRHPLANFWWQRCCKTVALSVRASDLDCFQLPFVFKVTFFKVKSRSYSRAYIGFKRLDDDIEFVELFTSMFLLIRWLYLSDVTTFNQIKSYYSRCFTTV